MTAPTDDADYYETVLTPASEDFKEHPQENFSIISAATMIQTEFDDRIDAWLSSELRLDEISFVEEKFIIRGWINVFWVDAGFESVFKQLTDENADIDLEDWHTYYKFPLDPCNIFTLTSIYELEHLKQPVIQFFADGNVCHLQLYFKAELLETLELYDFPFDYQFLNLKIKWNLHSFKLVGVCPKYVTDGTIGRSYGYGDMIVVSLKEALVSEVVLREPWIDFRALRKTSAGKVHDIRFSLIKLRIQRVPWYYVMNITSPFFIIVSCTFGIYAIDRLAIGERLGVVVTVLLTFAAFQSTISEELPKTSELLFIDIYVFSSYMIIFALLIQICFSSAAEDDKNGELEDAIGFLVFGVFWIVISLWYVVQGIVSWQNPQWQDRADKELWEWDKTNVSNIQKVDATHMLLDN